MSAIGIQAVGSEAIDLLVDGVMTEMAGPIDDQLDILKCS
jgi:hypothetical protein